jgi:hypothetical protein
MHWPHPFRRRSVSRELRGLDRRIAEISREIRRLDRFVANPKPERKRKEAASPRFLGPAVIPDSKRRFVSYLSAGSFGTIGLRKHEQRAARIKAAIAMAVIILGTFILVYAFLIPLFR